MPRSHGLSHIAMSVPPETLTDEFRTTIKDFYGELFDWREIESLRLPDRLTLAVGGSCYVNIRERSESMVCTGYEHFGLFVRSAAEIEDLWTLLDERGIEPEPLKVGEDGYRSFFFRHLLPLAMEVQFFPHMEPEDDGSRPRSS